MKRILALIAALIVVAACAAPPSNREATGPTNANAGNEPSAPAMTEADAIAKEKAVWETIKAKDYAAFEAILAPEQVEVVPDGVMDKAGTVAGVKQFEPDEINFSDWKYLSLDKDAYVVIYTVAVKGKFQGKEFPVEPTRCSSAWANRAGKWLAMYHQETPVKPPPPPPPAGTATATPAASPAATAAPPPATGPDPIANEKIVWDLFKSKNYDAFAQLLAPEFINVESDNVYDRAGTLRGVAMFDASKAVLSDWKSVNFDNDTAMVIYTVKNPVPGFAAEGERHTTIWVNRNGKWQGLFHHGGTPVRKPVSSPSPAATIP